MIGKEVLADSGLVAILIILHVPDAARHNFRRYAQKAVKYPLPE